MILRDCEKLHVIWRDILSNNMRTGPKPKPPKLKITPARPLPPDELTDPVSLKAWNDICDHLERDEHLSLADAPLIYLYSVEYALLQRVLGELANEELKQVAKGRAYINPLAQQVTVCTGKLAEYLSKLKLTQVNRGRHAKKSAENPDAGILKFIRTK